MPKRNVSRTMNILRNGILGCRWSSALTWICHRRQSVALLAKENHQNTNNERRSDTDSCKRQSPNLVSPFNLLAEEVWKRSLAMFASVVMSSLVLQPVPVSHAAPPTLNEAIVLCSTTLPFPCRSIDRFFLSNKRIEEIQGFID